MKEHLTGRIVDIYSISTSYIYRLDRNLAILKHGLSHKVIMENRLYIAHSRKLEWSENFYLTQNTHFCAKVKGEGRGWLLGFSHYAYTTTLKNTSRLKTHIMFEECAGLPLWKNFETVCRSDTASNFFLSSSFYPTPHARAIFTTHLRMIIGVSAVLVKNSRLYSAYMKIKNIQLDH